MEKLKKAKRLFLAILCYGPPLFKVGPGARLPGLSLDPGQSWETAGTPVREVFADSALGVLLPPPPLGVGGGRLGEFTVCIEKQKTTKNGQMATVKMSERVKM